MSVCPRKVRWNWRTHDLIRQRIDAMQVDEIVRLPSATAPSHFLVYKRAKRNGFLVCTHTVDDDVIYIRLK